MQTCKGCREQQTNEHLCLNCIEDLNCWLREIPALYRELGSVRLPGSVRTPGPSVRTYGGGSAAPVRLEVVDLLDRGETLARLRAWTDTGYDVAEICDGFRHHLLATAAEPWAGDFYRAIRGLCRDLGRVVGQPEDRPVGKCSQPRDGDELCRGQLLRTDAGTAYCRRCGHKPDITAQPVWVTLREAAMITGSPIETVRTWYKRGRLSWSAKWVDHSQPWSGWSGPIGPAPANRAWLPTAVRLANGSVATLPQRSGIVNHGSEAELSPLDRNQADTTAATRQMISDNGARSGSDTDVLGRLVTGNVTPSAGAPVGKAVAPIPSTPAEPHAAVSDPADHLTAGSDS